MAWDQIRSRCPSARFVCIAKAEGYRLAFTRFSKNRQCGAADMVLSQGAEVWGAVFEIAEDDVGKLDKSEDYRPDRPREQNAYERVELHVLRDGDKDSPLAVWTYFVVQKLDPCPKPSTEYKQLVLDGARHWRLPAKYIDQLERIEMQ